MGTGYFLRVESGRGVTLTPHPLLVPRSKRMSRATPLLSLRAFVACKKGETYLAKHTNASIPNGHKCNSPVTLVIGFLLSQTTTNNHIHYPFPYKSAEFLLLLLYESKHAPMWEAPYLH
jgi:hypothetical protein